MGERFEAWLKASPDTKPQDDMRARAGHEQGLKPFIIFWRPLRRE
jgi:hypothetical protein